MSDKKITRSREEIQKEIKEKLDLISKKKIIYREKAERMLKCDKEVDEVCSEIDDLLKQTESKLKELKKYG